MSNVVVGIGELLWDVFDSHKIVGGAPSNFAYHVSQFGMEGYAISAIGNDELGDEISKFLSTKKLNPLVSVNNYPTGTVFVKLSGAGIPSYTITEDVAWDYIPLTAEAKDLATKADAVCFGTLAQRNEASRKTIYDFISLMSPNALKIYDINLRLNYFNLEIISKSISLSNVLKINDDELVIVSKIYGFKGGNDEVIQSLFDKYPSLNIIILTCGTDGSYVYSRVEKSFLPTPIVTVADTVGAGDSFTAAFIAVYLKTKSIANAHKRAVDVSAFVCTQHGAMPILPTDLTC